jgi:hypothetical protein
MDLQFYSEILLTSKAFSKFTNNANFILQFVNKRVILQRWSSYFYNVDLSVMHLPCICYKICNVCSEERVLLVGSKLDPQSNSSQMKSLQGMFGGLNKIQNHINGSINGILQNTKRCVICLQILIFVECVLSLYVINKTIT